MIPQELQDNKVEVSAITIVMFSIIRRSQVNRFQQNLLKREQDE